MAKQDHFRDLLAKLRELGLTEYGSVIPSALVHQTLRLGFTETAPKSVFDKLALAELAAIDYCRNALLNEGKYLMGTTTGYRILLPSENAGQVEQYVGSADKKLLRALKLSRNTPPIDSKAHHPDQTAARILLKREGARRLNA